MLCIYFIRKASCYIDASISDTRSLESASERTGRRNSGERAGEETNRKQAQTKFGDPNNSALARNAFKQVLFVNL